MVKIILFIIILMVLWINRKKFAGLSDNIYRFSSWETYLFYLVFLILIASFFLRAKLVPKNPGGLFTQIWVIFVGLSFSLAAFNFPKKARILYPAGLLITCLAAYASLWFDCVYLFPLVPLAFVCFFIFSPLKNKRSRLLSQVAIVGFLLLFILGIKNTFINVTKINEFRKMDGTSIQEIKFYDFAKRFDLRQKNPDLVIDKKELVDKLVSTFPCTFPYEPNHEGPPKAYLVCIKRIDESELWFELGEGNRIYPDTAWVGLVGISSTKHSFSTTNYGTYQNKKLYDVLTSWVKLDKWEKINN